MAQDKTMMHIGLRKGQIGHYVLLPGSPERSEKTGAYFDDVEEVAYHREYRTFTGKLDGVKVSVCSTGMGCSSTAIAVEELCELGVHTMLRIGSCASTSPLVSCGDIVIPNGAIRMEGVGDHYLPIEFPAVPDMELVQELENVTQKLGYPYNIGPSITKASFYTQIDAANKPVAYDLVPRWRAYEMGGATSTEMESAILFLLGSCLGIRTATVLVSATNFEASSNDLKGNHLQDFEDRVIKVGIEALRSIIRQDKAAEEGVCRN